MSNYALKLQHLQGDLLHTLYRLAKQMYISLRDNNYIILI